MDDVIELEREGWEALSTGPDAAAAFYERTLAPEVLILLPGGMVLDDRAAVVDSMRGEPWSSFDLRDVRTLRLGDHAALVAYRADAVRGEQRYEALVASTYVLVDGSWRLAVHQQTPV